jgi:hypothetical protein
MVGFSVFFLGLGARSLGGLTDTPSILALTAFVFDYIKINYIIHQWSTRHRFQLRNMNENIIIYVARFDKSKTPIFIPAYQLAFHFHIITIFFNA